MKVTRVKNEQGVLRTFSDLGELAVWGKDYFLNAGVTLVKRLDKPMNVRKVFVPSLGDVAKTFNVDGSTDAVLVCLSRRGWTLRAEGREDDIPIPSYEEAEKELVSGKDFFGGFWPVPRLPSMVIEEELKGLI